MIANLSKKDSKNHCLDIYLGNRINVLFPSKKDSEQTYLNPSVLGRWTPPAISNQNNLNLKILKTIDILDDATRSMADIK